MRKITQDELSSYIGISKNSLESTCFNKGKRSKKSLSKLDLSRLDFREMDLIGIDFSYSNVSNCIFNYADLSGANFFNADLSGSDMSKSYIMGTTFYKTNLSHANFTDTCFDTCEVNSGTNVFGTVFDSTFLPILFGSDNERYFKYAFYTIPIGNMKDVVNWYWTIYARGETPLRSMDVICDDFLLNILLRHIDSVHSNKCLYVNHIDFKTIFEPEVLRHNSGLN